MLVLLGIYHYLPVCSSHFSMGRKSKPMGRKQTEAMLNSSVKGKEWSCCWTVPWAVASSHPQHEPTIAWLLICTSILHQANAQSELIACTFLRVLSSPCRLGSFVHNNLEMGALPLSGGVTASHVLSVKGHMGGPLRFFSPLMR